VSEPERSIAALYERYHQRLYRFCVSIVGNREDAQDALQNAMVKALRALPHQREEIRLKPWLYRIAHNESIEILRKRREPARVDPESTAAATDPGESVELRERLRRLLSDLSGLPERQRSALIMRELGGLGFEEIGEAFETSAAVARQTVYEARQSLRQMEAGREMGCEEVMRQISDADGRTLRRRDIGAHLKICAGCREFRDSIEGRRHDLAAIAPLPASASAGILHGLLGGAGGHTGAAAGAGTGAGAAGAGAGKVVAGSAVLKAAATVAVVATVGVTAADRGGLIHLGGRGGDITTQGTRQAEEREPGPGVSVGLGGAAGDGVGAAGQAAAGAGSAASAARGPAAATGTGAAGNSGAASNEQEAPETSPSAARHGQETAAAHKAEPNPHSARHGKSGPVGAHAHGGSGHSHSSHGEGAPHSHGASSHAHATGGGGNGGGHTNSHAAHGEGHPSQPSPEAPASEEHKASAGGGEKPAGATGEGAGSQP